MTSLHEFIFWAAVKGVLIGVVALFAMVALMKWIHEIEDEKEDK